MKNTEFTRTKLNILICSFLLSVSFSAFSQEDQRKLMYQSAVEFNDRALILFQQFSTDQDSIRKSLSLLDTAISRDSSFIDAHINKVSMLCTLGMYEDMLAELDDVRKMRRLDPELICVQGYILEKMGKGREASFKYAEADRLFDYFIKENQNSIKNSVGKAFLQFFIRGERAGLSEYKRLERKDKEVILYRTMFYDFKREDFIKNYCMAPRYTANNAVYR